ncbi:hypothetical protein [Dactylosporangium sp. CA-139066]|uniref:hypothetical protein n=1 Tax=Dactylosporangium sp. CA-139066 TaxID=3239930 RepID=UPI003D8EF6F5
MAERDPLRERFDAFRDESVRTARPPGPESIPGVLRRRKRRKVAVAAVAAAVAVLAVALLPTLDRGAPPRPPEPAISDSASPSASAAAVPSSAPAAAGSPGAAVGGPAGSATAKPSTCATPPDGAAYGDPYVLGSGVLNGDPYSIQPPTWFDKCPAYRLRFIEARYSWDRNRQLIVLASTTEHFLTKDSPTVKAPVISYPGNPCGEGLVALQTTRAAPASVSNSIQDQGRYLNYLQQHATAAFSHWTFPTTAQERGISGCGPPGATPSASATP